MADLDLTPEPGEKSVVQIPDAEPPATPPERPAGRRRRWLLPIGVAVILGAIGVIAIGLLFARRDQPPTQPLNVVAPTRLTAVPGTFDVTLTWIQPPGGPAVDSYRVYRNGDLQIRLGGGARTYVDDQALPGEKYEYALEAFSGEMSSSRTSIEVTTARAPLSLARLAGTYDIRAKTTSERGYSKTYDRKRFSFRLQPRCDKGPCATRLRIEGFNDLKLSLSRAGARYRDSAEGVFDVRCGDKRSKSSVTVELKVVKAAAVHGDWRATRLVGKLTHAEVPQHGCVPAGATLSLHGSLARVAV